MATLTGIYKITNKKTGECYIGQSRDILTRWNEHIDAAAHENSTAYEYPLQRAIRQNGINDFTFEILETDIYDKDELNRREKFYIEKYNAYSDGYNQTSGNTPTVDRRRLWTEEENQLLEKLVLEGKLNQTEIGEILGRSRQAVNNQASRLELRGPRSHDFWTDEKHQQLLVLRNEGKTQTEAAKILGVSKEATKKRWHDYYSPEYGKWR